MTKRAYELVVAKPYLCVAAILEMVLRYEGDSGLDQLQIANFFGVNLPEGTALPLNKMKFTRDAAQWGIVVPREGLGSFFRAFGLPLKDEFYDITKLQDWQMAERIEKALSQQQHVVCGFSYHALYGRGEPTEGHVNLILGLGERETVFLADPGPRNPGEKEVDLIDLFRAIHLKRDGLWILSRDRKTVRPREELGGIDPALRSA